MPFHIIFSDLSPTCHSLIHTQKENARNNPSWLRISIALSPSLEYFLAYAVVIYVLSYYSDIKLYGP